MRFDDGGIIPAARAFRAAECRILNPTVCAETYEQHVGVAGSRDTSLRPRSMAPSRMRLPARNECAAIFAHLAHVPGVERGRHGNAVPHGAGRIDREFANCRVYLPPAGGR